MKIICFLKIGMEEFLEGWRAQRQQRLKELQQDYNHTGSSKQMKAIKDEMRVIKFWLKPENQVKVAALWQATQAPQEQPIFPGLAVPQVDPALFGVVQSGTAAAKIANSAEGAASAAAKVAASPKAGGEAVVQAVEVAQAAAAAATSAANQAHLAAKMAKPAQAKQLAASAERATIDAASARNAAKKATAHLNTIQEENETNNNNDYRPRALNANEPGPAPAGNPFGNVAEKKPSFWNKTKKFFKSVGKQITRSFKYDKKTKARLYELNSEINRELDPRKRKLLSDEKERIKSGQTWNKKVGREISRSLKYGKNVKHNLYNLNARIEATRKAGNNNTALLAQLAEAKTHTWSSGRKERLLVFLRNQQEDALQLKEKITSTLGGAVGGTLNKLIESILLVINKLIDVVTVAEEVPANVVRAIFSLPYLIALAGFLLTFFGIPGILGPAMVAGGSILIWQRILPTIDWYLLPIIKILNLAGMGINTERLEVSVKATKLRANAERAAAATKKPLIGFGVIQGLKWLKGKISGQQEQVQSQTQQLLQHDNPFVSQDGQASKTGSPFGTGSQTVNTRKAGSLSADAQAGNAGSLFGTGSQTENTGKKGNPWSDQVVHAKNKVNPFDGSPLTTANKSVGGLFQNVINNVGEAVGSIGGAVADGAQAVVNAGVGVGGAVAGGAQAIVNAGVGLGGAVVNAGASGVGAVGSAVAGGVEALREGGVGAVARGANAVLMAGAEGAESLAGRASALAQGQLLGPESLEGAFNEHFAEVEAERQAQIAKAKAPLLRRAAVARQLGNEKAAQKAERDANNEEWLAIARHRTRKTRR